MRIEPRLILALTVLAALSACNGDELASTGPALGESVRQTMLAQVIDPDPQYDTAVPPSSAEAAGQAIERYRTDKVKQPERPTTQQASGSSGSK